MIIILRMLNFSFANTQSPLWHIPRCTTTKKKILCPSEPRHIGIQKISACTHHICQLPLLLHCKPYPSISRVQIFTPISDHPSHNFTIISKYNLSGTNFHQQISDHFQDNIHIHCFHTFLNLLTSNYAMDNVH